MIRGPFKSGPGRPKGALNRETQLTHVSVSLLKIAADLLKIFVDEYEKDPGSEKSHQIKRRISELMELINKINRGGSL